MRENNQVVYIDLVNRLKFNHIILSHEVNVKVHLTWYMI